MSKLVWLLFGVLAVASLAVGQEEFDEYSPHPGQKDADVAASEVASSLGIDGTALYEDLVRIRDQVVPLAEQYGNINFN